MWERKEAGSSGWKNIGDFGKWQTGAQPGQNEWSLGTTQTGNDDMPSFSIEIGETNHSVHASTNIAAVALLKAHVVGSCRTPRGRPAHVGSHST